MRFLGVLLGAWSLIFLEAGAASSKQQKSETRSKSSMGELLWVAPAHGKTPGINYKTFYSHIIDGPVSYLVYLPPDYDRDTTKCYPVMYWLHGGGGNQEAGTHFVEIFDRAVRAGKVPPLIVVLVNGLRQSMYNDSVDGKQPVESVIVKDLIPHVDETYQTISSREGRGVEGFSMGGYGAAHLGFKYPELFGVVSVLSGALMDWDFFDRLGKKRGKQNALQAVFGDNQEYFDENHPFTLAKKNSAPSGEEHSSASW